MPDVKFMAGDIHLYRCAACQFPHVGMPPTDKCVKCGCVKLNDEGVVPEGFSVPNQMVCSQCFDVTQKVAAATMLGSICISCSDCRKFSVVHPDNPKFQLYSELFPGKNLCRITSNLCGCKKQVAGGDGENNIEACTTSSTDQQ